MTLQSIHRYVVERWNPGAEREREIALVHSASLAYEDGSVFMSIAMGPDTAQKGSNQPHGQHEGTNATA